MGSVAEMQMVQEAAEDQSGRMAPGCPDGRAPGLGPTITKGPWSVWPHEIGTLCLTGWVIQTMCSVCLYAHDSRSLLEKLEGALLPE